MNLVAIQFRISVAGVAKQQPQQGKVFLLVRGRQIMVFVHQVLLAIIAQQLLF